MLSSVFKGGRSLALRTCLNMSKAATDLRVIHDENNMEFYIKLGHDKAFLQYDILNSDTKAVDLQHTVVPEAFRGQGVAKILAKEAFEYFLERDQKMKLTCWYLQKYYQDNPLPQYAQNIIES